MGVLGLKGPIWTYFGGLYACLAPPGSDLGMRECVWGRIMTSWTLLEVIWPPENFSGIQLTSRRV